MPGGPHFFVDAVEDGTAVLEGDEAHHLARVMRVDRGDPVSLSDGRGTVWQARVAELGEQRVVLRTSEAVQVPPPRPRVVVVHALPRQRKLDDVVQRLTEVGVDEIRPVHSERSEVRLEGARGEKAVRRWRAVVHAAAKQSRRAWLPQVRAVGEWTSAFAGARHGVVCWEESRVPLREVFESLREASEVVLGIGPEGGLTQDEVRLAALPHASLGPTVLRTETAAVVAVSALRYELGLMR